MAGGPRIDMVRGSGIDEPDGLRAWGIDGQIVAPAIGPNVAPGKDFIDPFIALRGMALLSDRWSLPGYRDVGGLGSDLT